MDKSSYIVQVVSWAEKKGFTEIKATIEGYDSPSSFFNKDGVNDITPDVTGVSMYARHFLEVAMKADTERNDVTKWKLLGEIAAIKGGKLYLMVPRGHLRYITDLVSRYQLQAEIVKLG